jgi:hypothetical protein
MDWLKLAIAIAAYFAALGAGIGCAWLMHRRATARRKAGATPPAAAESANGGLPG